MRHFFHMTIGLTGGICLFVTLLLFILHLDETGLEATLAWAPNLFGVAGLGILMLFLDVILAIALRGHVDVPEEADFERGNPR